MHLSFILAKVVGAGHLYLLLSIIAGGLFLWEMKSYHCVAITSDPVTEKDLRQILVGCCVFQVGAVYMELIMAKRPEKH